MALDFATTDTKQVDFGSDASVDSVSAGTYIVWVNVDDVSNDFYSYCNKGVDIGPAMFRNGADGTAFYGSCRTTTNALQQASSSTSTLAVGWNYIAFTWDITNGGQKVWHGNLTTLVSDVTGSTTDNTGTIKDDSASSLIVGRWPEGGFNRSVDGSIALFAMFGIELTLAQLQWQQQNIWQPIDPANCLVFSNLGFNGTGSQRDWSSNGNHGTVTGATVDLHVPLPLPSPVWALKPAAAAAGPGAIMTTNKGFW